MEYKNTCRLTRVLIEVVGWGVSVKKRLSRVGEILGRVSGDWAWDGTLGDVASGLTVGWNIFSCGF